MIMSDREHRERENIFIFKVIHSVLNLILLCLNYSLMSILLFLWTIIYVAGMFYNYNYSDYKDYYFKIYPLVGKSLSMIILFLIGLFSK